MAVRPDVGTIAVPSPALYRGNQIIWQFSAHCEQANN
jgi:hypothetical protein